MVYTLTFRCKGKGYSNFETTEGVARKNQYEAIAYGLLVGKLEQEKLSRENVCIDLALVETNEKGESNVVWSDNQYTPVSSEVKEEECTQ